MPCGHQNLNSREASILAAVREIPEGFVRTYGDASPGAPRMAGRVLAMTDEPGLPWWRVVRADGSLAAGQRQREKLMEEDVPFKPGGKVDLAAARLSENLGWPQPSRGLE
jgi:methylated-DNA-protein-cysteine methyltransferase-like protein